MHALPHVSASVLPNADVCAGDQIALFCNRASQNTWTLGVTDGVAFTLAGSATYQVTATDDNSCRNTANIAMSVHELPVVQLLLAGDEIQCIETASLALEGGSNTGGVYSGDGVVDGSKIPSVAGLNAAII